MSEFQNIVMIVAVILLIISLLILAVVMWNNRFAKLYPPVLPGCPDYWTPVKSDDGKVVCKNAHHLGTNHCSGLQATAGVTYNPTSHPTSPAQQAGDQCNALNSARWCGVTWDGITNNTKIINTCQKKLYA